jgi:hypothetical protein
MSPFRWVRLLLPGFPAVLLWAFAKNEAADLSPAQNAQVKWIAGRLIEDFGGKA